MPTAGSTSSGSVSIVSNAYDSTLSIPLTGAGAGAGILNANPASDSFGSVQVGSSASQYQSVTNSGGSNVNISHANVSGSGFSISGLSLPITLTPGQSYTLARSLRRHPRALRAAASSWFLMLQILICRLRFRVQLLP